MTRPTTPYPSESGTPPVGDASVGQLIGELASDLSTLLRQEMELAKAELKQEVSKAGKGAGLLGGAGYAGLMLGICASLTLIFLLDLAMPLWIAALLVTLAWAAAGFVMFQSGRKQIKTVHPTPTQTVDSIKETF
ncbi:MAG: uncharacterized protein JWO22_2367 [Frankiales bacterium]|nr:uncharacterized protein [Frankiales bacterium]